MVLADGGEAFVKTRPDAAPGEYAAEAAGLELAGRARRAAHAAGAGGRRALPGAGVDRAGRLGVWTARRGGARPGARGDARAPVRPALACWPVRFAGGSDGAGFGCSADPTGRASARCGSPTSRRPTGPRFYAERRLRPLARIARERGALSAIGARGGGARVRAPARAGRPARAARAPARRPVVGQRDGRRGRPCVADRSLRVRRAPRGRPGDAAGCSARRRERVFAAYEEVAPLAEGWQERVELYQLLPLLVHALLFGGSYGGCGRDVSRGATHAEPRSGLRRAWVAVWVPRGRRADGCASADNFRSPAACICSRGWSIARHYRRELTLAEVARALSSSPRQLQRAYRAVRRDDVPRGPARAAHGRRSAAAGRAALDPRARRGAPRRLQRRRRTSRSAFRRRYGLSPARFRARRSWRSASARATPLRSGRSVSV